MHLVQFPMAVQQSTHGVQHFVTQLWMHLPQEMRAALMHRLALYVYIHVAMHTYTDDVLDSCGSGIISGPDRNTA